MAGTIKVDSINADSNLALKIANTAVAFIDATGLRPVAGNLNLDATATSKLYLPSANTVAIQTAGVTAVTVDSSQNVTLAGTLTTTGITNSGVATGARFNPTGSSVTGNGMYLPAANSLGLSTNGTNAVYIDSAGSVAIGSTSTASATRLTVKGAGTGTNTIFNCQDSGGTALLTLAENGTLKFNSGYGSNATAYGCRAWATMNCVSFTVTAGGNVSSITNYGTGDNAIAFTTAMPDANYSLVGASIKGGGAPSATNSALVTMGEGPSTTGTGFGIILGNGSAANRNIGYVAVFR
jgi:hypothetical protein